MANTPVIADQDPVETKEWLEAYESVLQHEGADRAAYLLNQLLHVPARRERAFRLP